MTKNYSLFVDNPMEKELLNNGVAEVGDVWTDEKLRLLRYELKTFVCEGQYAKGMARIFGSYLSNLTRPEQPAVWVSGFFGSGKSHFVKMLRHLWVDYTFQSDQATARGLTKLPDDVKDQLRELSTMAKRSGGLFAASGTLGAGASNSVRLAFLSIIYRSLGLPDEYAVARFLLWLKREGIYDKVKKYVDDKGKDFQKEARSMYVSTVLAEAILAANKGFAPSAADVKMLLKEQYPKKEDVSTTEMVEAARDAIGGTNGTFPCTLIVLDEVQQYIGEDKTRTYAVQELTEACCSNFGGKLLFVATGQMALAGTPDLQKLRDRFRVSVELSDTDVETVIRKMILAKKPDKTPLLKETLEKHVGEINRHLVGTRIAPRTEDREDFILDYPLLPVRRRFWELSLRAVDRAGTSAQLRSQITVVHEATRVVADKPVGTVVSGDFMYDQKASDMINSGILPRELYQLIQRLDSGNSDDILRARLCKLIFIINQLPREKGIDAGIRATVDILADLMLEDLQAGSADLRQKIPTLIESLMQDGHLMQVENEYRIQTCEFAAWDSQYRDLYAKLINDASTIAAERTNRMREESEKMLKDIKLLQGKSKVPRKVELHFGSEMPTSNGQQAVPVWIRDGWNDDDKSVAADARKAGTESPVVFVFIPNPGGDELKKAFTSLKAASRTLDARGLPAHEQSESTHAYQAMETRKRDAETVIRQLMADIFSGAKVYLGGGSEVPGIIIAEAVKDAAERCLARLYPKFDVADNPAWEKVVDRAKAGDGGALGAVDSAADPEKNPVCIEVLKSIGAGKKGGELRKAFSASPYGWPQDSIDGAIMALLVNGHVAASINGKGVEASELDRTKITVTDLRQITIIITIQQRMAIRGLCQGLEVSCKPNEEAMAVKVLLENVSALAGKAGGEPPLPDKPDPAYLKELFDLSGNEQLVAVYDKREQLSKDAKAWQQTVDKIAKRRPMWETLQSLLAHAKGLPIANEVTTQRDAIYSQRSLLNEPDSLPTLCESLTDALRAAVVAAQKDCSAIYDAQMKTLHDSPTWGKLKDEQQKTILSSCGVQAIGQVKVGTEQELLDSLEHMNLGDWGVLKDALPQRFQNAMTQAAKLLVPKARKVALHGATINNEQEADEWLAQAKKTILDNLKDGPVIV